jgi:hypothetical protein
VGNVSAPRLALFFQFQSNSLLFMDARRGGKIRARERYDALSSK